ncbi:hypothetical protein JCM10908_004843 [Rhodotorula pacifica]|uniref:glycosyltransferase family 15 protein n=1 Tax=Rhodotorula pacifica TaxID=1495444 RepID=UPI003173A676
MSRPVTQSGATRTPVRASRIRRVVTALLPAVFALLVALWIAYPPLPSPPTSSSPPPPPQGCYDPTLTTLEPREKGAILVLLRAQDLPSLLPTLENFEKRFNTQFRYPYVFLTDPDEGDLPASFRQQVARVLPTGAETEWGVVPEEHWRIPEWLDEEDMRRGFKEQEERGVMYAGREGYHHMCRWYSGLWARHPLLAKYEWYWRLEPGVRFHCTITYDPFRYLSQHNKTYGFVITVVDQINTIPTLIPTTLDYLREKGIDPPSAELWEFLMRRNGAGEYAACHFWTNFEIGDLRFFRSKEYQDYFRFLDRKGGFYSERWGDAPVRALALGALAGLDEIHYFEDIAYQHDWFMHCPSRSTTSFSRRPRNERVVAGCDCACPKAGELQGRKVGQELVDMDEDWRYSCISFWKDAVRKATSG